MTFAAQVIDFHRELKPDWKIPEDIELLYPFENKETTNVFEEFFNKYFSDHKKRIFLFGINPGRFGAGITGIPFTDPKILEDKIGIFNSFKKRHELSSLFIYEMIEAYGGLMEFYSDCYITSVCPLGFVTKGKNINYYDQSDLLRSVESEIIDNIRRQACFGARKDVAFSIGKGKNFKYLQKLNQEYGFFDRIESVPHPRWVMQYRLKMKDQFIDEYISKLKSVLFG